MALPSTTSKPARLLMDQNVAPSRPVRHFFERAQNGAASRQGCKTSLARPISWIPYSPTNAIGDASCNINRCSYSTTATGCARRGDLIPIRIQHISRRIDPWVYRITVRADVIACSASSRYRCLSAATCRKTWSRFPSSTESPEHTAVERSHGSVTLSPGRRAQSTGITEAVQTAAKVTFGLAATAGAEGSDPRVIVVYDLSQEVVDYEQAWAWQRALLDRAAAAAADEGTRGCRNAVLLLQHPPVYTLGAGSTTDHLRFIPDNSTIPLYRTERGGEVTYHGPGQLVMYPILDLQALKPDLHWYLRQLEEVVIQALDAVSGIRGERLEGLTGVWVDGAKVAAIGVRAKKWVAYHGLALNVVTDLSPFSRIVPCGIADRPVTSVKKVLAERQRALDPFAPAEDDGAFGTAMESRGGGSGGGGGGAISGYSEMMPLSQASQDDLRRMLARTGMTPTTLKSITSYGAEGGTAVPELDDPFAPLSPSLSLPSGDLGQDAQVDDAEAATMTPDDDDVDVDVEDDDGDGEVDVDVEDEDDDGDGRDGRGTEDVGDHVNIRSCWTESEHLLLREYGCALLVAFANVFDLELRSGDPGDLKAL
ncbi:hypothetical protein VaNZ11_012675 [Volvox africanus]|uniref:lipoyl(octanoyl) transferase n=1 Tax=Volvox africanus TaxID=51714 RepID=A0ABQ5SFZ2_9CHLO|nr:hypothetical protein VaNZ11_012675 [Volvox africanus]